MQGASGILKKPDGIFGGIFKKTVQVCHMLAEFWWNFGLQNSTKIFRDGHHFKEHLGHQFFLYFQHVQSCYKKAM